MKNELGARIVTGYCQDWSQSIEERVSVLNAALLAAGIGVRYIQEYDKAGNIVKSGFVGPFQEGKRAQKFREELEGGWWHGDFNEEAAWVEDLIKRYKERKD